MKVKIKCWNGVATWLWVANDENCGICRMAFNGCCPDCKVPGDDCPLVWGQCSHCFHMHCILKWLKRVVHVVVTGYTAVLTFKFLTPRVRRGPGERGWGSTGTQGEKDHPGLPVPDLCQEPDTVPTLFLASDKQQKVVLRLRK
ncbi:Hypothetical predicted protein [Marmota monax]|uniref:Anaphase-promoting complex subunit 11 RING-H2 finger domain-containing protein n=1 Tax=Marmota monax TaxID=9995 RepID=A0A5E4AMA1_MARMO|nr:Hypothetical predicted protein [Marmota monax]